MPLIPVKAAMEVYPDMLSRREKKIPFWYLCLGRVLVYKTPNKKLLPQGEVANGGRKGGDEASGKSLDNAGREPIMDAGVLGWWKETKE